MKEETGQRSKVKSQKENETADAFDRAAVSYDADFDSLPSTIRLRRIVQSVLLTYFHPGNSILELNCGTGTDAIALAQRAVRVHATDISPVMVEKVRTKSSSLGLDNLITTEVLSFADLSRLNPRQFDGAFSDMGGLNCTDDIQRIAQDIASLISPGGYFAACIMPSFCLWETMSFMLRGRFSDAFRRMNKNGVVANVHGLPVQTHYNSVGYVKDVFSKEFEHVRTIGLNVFTPPPTSLRAYNRLGLLNRMLESIDDGVAEIPPFNRIGDHFLMILRRKSQ